MNHVATVSVRGLRVTVLSLSVLGAALAAGCGAATTDNPSATGGAAGASTCDPQCTASLCGLPDGCGGTCPCPAPIKTQGPPSAPPGGGRATTNPPKETCNGKDDDGDGKTDEDLGWQSCGEGECAEAVPACSDGMTPTCTPRPAGTESCNRKDDDCDGQTDEDLGWQTCGEGECLEVVAECVDGLRPTCVPRPPRPEECNGKDDDCDGETDERLGEVTCGVGKCQVTVASCQHGTPVACVPLAPSTDVCNGIDDDCDGFIDEEPCDDGNACTTEDGCVAGKCKGHKTSCDDQNPCTDDSCHPASGCAHAPNSHGCDDGDACTPSDACVGGSCVGTGAIACNDQNPCTLDLCDPAWGCYLRYADAPCNDQNACTTVDWCIDGKCIGLYWNECHDGNVCTSDGCDPASGCTHTPNDEWCTDGDACTYGDGCIGGACVPGGPRDCTDWNVCTSDSCDPATGCKHANNAAPCDDGNECTTADTCGGGSCHGGPPPKCDDANPCTEDACHPDAGCFHEPSGQSCEDGSVCTENDHCLWGVCQPGQAVSCDDGIACTQDSCSAKYGCQHVANPAACNDSNPCTTDTCSTMSGCAHAALANGTACDDGNACTGACPGQPKGLIARHRVSTAWTDPNVGVAQGGHTLILGGPFDGHSGVVFTGGSDLYFDVYDNGTAHMHGTLTVSYVSGGPGLGSSWKANLHYTYRGKGPAGQGSGGPKIELKAGVVTGTLWATWDFYDLKSNGTLTQVGAPGNVLYLSQKPAGSVYPFQVGSGANGKSLNFGASSWVSFVYYVNDCGKTSGQGDFNVDFTPQPLCKPGDACQGGSCTGAPAGPGCGLTWWP